MTIEYRDNLVGVNWEQLKVDLASDHFDNGRSPRQLQRSFENSPGELAVLLRASL